MEAEKIVLENTGALVRVVMQHGGGKGSPQDTPSEIKSATGFICRIECNDGVLLDFYAPNAQIAGQFPPEITGDAQKILKKSINEFVQIVSDPDPFVAVIKGHAYLEALVTSIITIAFLEPSALDTERMTFWQKVNLCVAAGLIHSDVGHVLKEFARIRNEFAHQLWPTFTEKELCDLLNVLRQSNRLRELLRDHESACPDVFDCVWTMWIYLFEQVCRVTVGRKLLAEFWRRVVDVDDPVPTHATTFPLKPTSM